MMVGEIGKHHGGTMAARGRRQRRRGRAAAQARLALAPSREQVEVGRPLRDAGRLAVIVTAVPLAGYVNRGARHRSTPADVRADARRRPETADAAMVGTAVRFTAWICVFVASLPTFIVCAFARRLLGAGADPVLIPVMTVAAFTGMFAICSVLVQIGRLTVLLVVGWRGFPVERWDPHRWQDGPPGRKQRILAHRPNGIVRWMCTPSHLDGLFALFWALAFTPLIMGGVPR
ncbi:MAG: hypothetical protein AUG44_15300 [Actinobacteria bacterium 13_1_20CM_3_71_11]|nr:MAG: hypothetical protein AUG44_15300 [Actinobacteria bacterium 13_1_20CM_3_71_11]